MPYQATESTTKPSQATKLIGLVDKFPVFTDQDNRAFIEVNVGGHTENWEIASSTFQDWLSHQYFLSNRQVTTNSSISDAIKALKGRAMFDGNHRTTFLRAAKTATGYWIDIGDPGWTSIHIESGQWTAKQSSDANFYRKESTKPMVLPRHNGSIEPLWECVNIPEHERLLIITYLIECLRPDTNFPVLIFDGEQGSAKSTTQQCLKEILDPSATPLRVAPRKEQDLFFAAANDYLLSYNNLSYLSPEQQDALCCLSTGGSYAARALYTNNQEVVVSIQRPVVMNGIGALVTAQDLLERSLYIDLPIIEESQRRTDGELTKHIEENRPVILGGLLNIMSKALKILPEIPDDNLPRMADFTLLGRAVAIVTGKDASDFDDCYNKNQRQALEKGLDNSPIYPSLKLLITNYPQGFLGNHFELLQILDRYVDYKPANWPKTPKALGAMLKREAAAFRKVGINIVKDGRRTENGYRVAIDRL